MKREEYGLTMHESVAAWILRLYLLHDPEKKPKGQAAVDDGLLRKIVLEAIEWYENEDSARISASPYYPFIKKQYEEYLVAVKTDEFWEKLSAGFRKCAMNYVQQESVDF